MSAALVRLQRLLIRVGALAEKETWHLVRDPRALIMGLGVPVVLLLLFGFGVRFDIADIPLVVVDYEQSARSRDLVRAFSANGEFDLVGELADAEEVEPAFRRGRAAIGLVIPPDFSDRLARGEPSPVQLLVDGADATSARQAMGKAEVMAQAAALRFVGAGDLAKAPPVDPHSWIRFNPTSASALYLVPGLTGLILAMMGVMLTALAVAREWEWGSMEQLFATPVGRLEIVLGKLLPYLVLAVLQVLLVLAVGAWVFEVPVRGSLPLLALSSLLFMASMLGQGLLISVVARNQMLASQVATVSSMLPTMLLSGFLFPIENMPWPLRAAAAVVPGRYYITTLRGVLLRGNGFAELWDQQVPLLAFTLAMVLLSTARFKRRLA